MNDLGHEIVVLVNLSYCCFHGPMLAILNHWRWVIGGWVEGGVLLDQALAKYRKQGVPEFAFHNESLIPWV